MNELTCIVGKDLKKENIFMDCTRFDNCSVNNCPLHPRYPKLPTLAIDFERKCKARKSTRVSLAIRSLDKLPYEGLTVAEWKREERRRNRTPEQVEIDRIRGKKLSEIRSLRSRERKAV